MINILLCSLIVSLFCNGFHIGSKPKMFLFPIRKKLDKYFVAGMESYGDNFDSDTLDGIGVSRWYYPILYCIKCMPSIYGTAISFILLPFTLHLFYQIPLVIFCSVTLNCIFYQMYE